MAFLLIAALLIASLAALAVGIIAGSAPAFMVAALASGLTIFGLWRQLTKRPRQQTFVTDQPARVAPTWDKPLKGGPAPDSDSLERDDVIQLDPPAVAIDAYEELVASEILPMLETLSVEELRAVIKRERAGLGRVAVINRAQTLIDLTLGTAIDLNASERVTAGRQRPERDSLKKRGPDLSI